jgi:hypothetical protein
MLATPSSIKELIQAKCPTSELDILNKFVSLLDTYKINYTVIKGVPHFVVSNLARSKGLDPIDFSKNFIKEGKCILGGVFKKIEGDILIKFKEAWIKDNTFQFNQARSLWITDFVGAYHYLSSGNSEQAKDFKDLGANSIETVVRNATKSNVVPMYPKETYLKAVGTLPEELLHDAICALSSYTSRHFKREQIVPNSFNDQSARTRRFDLVEKAGRRVKVYELKANRLTTDHIKDAIGEKGYLELAALKYPKKTIKFYFVAADITPSAQRLLNQMKKIEFVSLPTLVEELVAEIREEFKSADSEWYLQKEILPKFANVLPSLMPAA